METPEKNPPNGRTTEDRGVRTIGQHLDRVSGSAQDAWSETRGAFSELNDAIDLKGRVKRHPYGTVAAALGIGYVLGGGIFTPLTSRIVRLGLRLGVRLALLPLLKDQVEGIAEVLGQGDDETERATGKSRNKSASKRT
jgi:hypothetical protein